MVIGAIMTPVVLIPVVVAIHAGAYNSFVDSALTGFGMWGTFTIHLWTRPSRKEALLTVILGLALRVAYDLAVGERGYVGSSIIGMGTFLGFASLLVMAARCLGHPGERRAVCRRTLVVLALLTYLGFCLGFYLSFAKLILPTKFDYYLYNFDGSLGFQASFLVGKLTARFPWLFWTEVMVYNSFGFWFSLVYAAHANTRKAYPVDVIKMLVGNALIGFSLYMICPATGPKYAFPSFPNVPGPVHAAPVLLSGVPNAIPSLHFGGALLLFWFLKPWKWVHRAMGLFTALTALTTMGLGEHYLIDLVVGVPYALAILAFSSKVVDRRLPLCAGAAMVMFWLCALRFAVFPGVLSWMLVLATVGTSFVLQHRLAERLWAPGEPAEESSDLLKSNGNFGR